MSLVTYMKRSGEGGLRLGEAVLYNYNLNKGSAKVVSNEEMSSSKPLDK